MNFLDTSIPDLVESFNKYLVYKNEKVKKNPKWRSESKISKSIITFNENFKGKINVNAKSKLIESFSKYLRSQKWQQLSHKIKYKTFYRLQSL